MSRQTRFPVLEQEPRTHGPPPAYRSNSGTETDTWSQHSEFSGMGKRRASWTNLVESDENLNKHKVNCYPKVNHRPKGPGSTTSTFPVNTVSSRTSSQMGQFSGYDYQVKTGFPVFADPSVAGSVIGVAPAGTIHYSRPPSKNPSLAQVIVTESSSIPPKVKRNRLQECKAWCTKPAHAICLLFLVLVLIIAAIIAIVLTQVLVVPSNISMSWLPPEMVRGGQNQPSKVQMKADGSQIKMSLQGQIPFKGNYISYYDFKSNRVAIVDESLKSNGNYLACFVIPLDRSNLKDEKTMRAAAHAARKKTTQTQGWQEQWSWMPTPLLSPPPFNPPINECKGARWIQLDYISTNQQNRKCSDCHDFCLPDYGIEKDQIRDENYLNIIKRDCFYLFVPEWRAYAQANSIEQNQRDFEQYYRNRNHITTSQGNGAGESKWIPLSVPQQVMNATRQVASGVVNAVGGAIDNARSAILGNSQPYTNGQNNVNNNNNNNNNGMYGMGHNSNGVSGVVNLQGVNGNNGQNLYNVANSQPYVNSGQSQPYVNNNNNNNNGHSNGHNNNGYSNGQQHMNGGSTYPQQQQQQQQQSGGYVPDVVAQPPAQSLFVANGFNNPGVNQYMGIDVGNARQPVYPDASGINHPAGYIPQVQQNLQTPQGVAGMALPATDNNNNIVNTGYTPDVVQQQQQQQQLMPAQGGRWIAG